MAPTLRPGDWLLVDPLAYASRSPQAGELIVARDPRSAERWLVKRVTDIATDGSLSLSGDHPAHSADDLTVPPGHVIGRPWLRYWPPARLGWLR